MIRIDKTKITFRKTIKGKNEIYLEGINMVATNFNIPQECDGEEVTVIRKEGKIIKIICQENEYVPEVKIPKKEANTKQYQQNQQNIKDMPVAKAPYNFVPLNNSVVEAEQIPDFDKYHSDRYTGCIEIELKTLTPLYIRNSDKDKDKDKEFFNVNGKYMISGSSLRGLIRTMVEIMSFGKFGFFNDERLYYRAVGDTSSLGKDYRGKLLDKNNNYNYKFKVGILKKENNKYVIYPSKIIQDTQIYRINFKHVPSNIRLSEFEFKEIYFKPEKSTNHTHYRKSNNPRIPYQLNYALLNSVSLEQSNQHHQKGYIISSGGMNNKHMHWVINEEDTSQPLLILSEDVVNSYKNDKLRKKEFDLLSMLNEHKKVPCFYILNKKNEVEAFGHTGLFRLPYEKTIGEHIPKELKDANKTDLAEAIFGKESHWASRVFFEDAILIDNSEDSFYQPTSPKILSGPKPTTFQHYVEQPENATSENINHWNSNANIRGYKLYWHRKTSNNLSDEYSWNEGKVINDTQHTVIRPVKEQKTFTDRIRFENLSEVELGALLFALDLPANCAHKLGMGKPLGLGSVKISIKNLFISDRENSYKKLFENNSWFLPQKGNKTKDDFKVSFEQYVLQNLHEKDKSNAKKLWDTPRMIKLQKLLDWSNTEISGWNEKTRYMEIEYKNVTGKKENEFKKRPVLPSPTEYVKEN